MRYK